MQVLILEPDRWRYVGISQILQSQGGITVLGDSDYKKILGLSRPPQHLKPDVVIVSHSLTLDYHLEILNHLQKLFPGAQLLVDGYDESLEGIARVLRAGAKGYFQLSSDAKQFVKALAVVEKGHIWAPRGIVKLLVGESPLSNREDLSAAAEVTVQELSLLTLLQKGLPNKEIARSLGIAEVTVKAHLTRLYRRFGVHTRLELLTYALHHRILSDRHSLTSHTVPDV